MSAASIEPSSFRDPDSRVVESDGAILRLRSEQGLRDWQALEASALFGSAVPRAGSSAPMSSPSTQRSRTGSSTVPPPCSATRSSRPGASAWSDYGPRTHYADADTAAKDHHVSISGNVPVRELLDWPRALESTLVVEFPTPEDPLVQRLLARKRDGTHPDYERSYFERALGDRFDVESQEELSSGTRVLYVARPKV